MDKQKLEEARQLAMSMTSHPVAFGTIEHTEKAGELLAELAAATRWRSVEAEQPRNGQAKRTAELCLSAWATARMDALEAKNAALAREAHTWWTAARDAMKLREPLAPEVIEAAAAEAFGFEGGLQEVNLGDLLHFARVLEQRHGIGA